VVTPGKGVSGPKRGDLNTGGCGVVSACSTRDEAEVRFEVPDQIGHTLIIADSTIGVAADPGHVSGCRSLTQSRGKANVPRPGTAEQAAFGDCR
jgi:hypothetical protein